MGMLGFDGVILKGFIGVFGFELCPGYPQISILNATALKYRAHNALAKIADRLGLSRTFASTPAYAGVYA